MVYALVGDSNLFTGRASGTLKLALALAVVVIFSAVLIKIGTQILQTVRKKTLNKMNKEKRVKLKTSTEIGSIAALVGEEKAVEMVAKAGFDAWDFSMFRMKRFENDNRPGREEHPLNQQNYLKFVRRLKQIGLDHGIVCNQSHAPFPVTHPECLDGMKRAIECTAEAGGNICIIHPDNDKSAEQNAEMYAALLPFAKEHGVRIAAENMWLWDKVQDQAMFAACATPEDFNAHLDAVNDDCFVACLDIGHAEMRGSGTSAVEMIHALGHRLQALHIHDNDKWHDSHQIPFSMQIDFEAVVKALKDIHYQGYFTLEADRYLSAYDASTAFEGVKKLAESAKRLVRMYEGK